MKCVIAGAELCTAKGRMRRDILIENGKIAALVPQLPHIPEAVYFQLNDCIVFPGFVDVHVHLREPGFSYKETMESGTMAAARGGYTAVCAMPNINPTPDCPEHLAPQLARIREGARVRVYPYGTITKGEQGEELADLEGLAPDVVAFSDDGRGVQNEAVMEKAMEKAAKLGKLIVAHCEDNSLLHGGYIHDGDYARMFGHAGISSESEWRQIERDLDLVRKTGAGYHVCHVSTRQSVTLIRMAKTEGLNVTCETAPHYLTLTDLDLQEDGRFKMNPPLRSESDRQALLQGLKDGTVDLIATDHAPHSAEEKSKGLKGSLMGVVGLETAFPILFTKLVRSGLCSLEELITWLHDNPSRRFGIGTPLEVGQPADLTAFDLTEQYIIDPAEFQSKGRSTPFAGEKVWGRCRLTMVNGDVIWEE